MPEYMINPSDIMIKFTAPEDQVVRVTDRVTEKVTEKLQKRLQIGSNKSSICCIEIQVILQLPWHTKWA